MNWMRHAACRGMNPDLFFPERGGPGAMDAVEAQKVCRSCPVRAECLEAGIGEIHGIWGGTTPKQRRLIRRQRKLRDIA